VGLANAQESVNAAGGNASSSSGSVSYSVGQVVYKQKAGTTGNITQGVQHAYEIYNVGIKENIFNISLKAFPNPTTDVLNLTIKNFKNQKLAYSLYSSNGKLIEQGKIENQLTKIDMNKFVSATYIMQVYNSKKDKIQSFKIIKK